MLSVFLLFIRIHQPVGEISYLPKLSSKEIPKYLKEHQKTVIIYTENKDQVSILNQGISKYKNKINFALSQPDYEQCNEFPCVIPFLNGQRMRVQDSPLRPLLFINWLEIIANPHNVTIGSVEQLRYLLFNDFPVNLAVDGAEVPKDFPEDVPVYKVSSEFLEKMNLIFYKYQKR